MSNKQRKKGNWVDYKELKERITMEMVLSRYGIFEKLKPSGNNLVGICPIHKGSNPRQFSVDPERNIFNCFGNCKAGGNVMDFVAKMENISIREAGLLMKKWFFSGSPEEFPKHPETTSPPKTKGAELIKEEKPAESTGQSEETSANALVNPALPFELKSLVADHEFFSQREIAPETAKHFGLGFCSRGMMAGRIAIPIHNDAGELVAYCGRAVNKEQIEKDGKYKLPPKFHKLAVVYNLNRQENGRRSLILFESYLSVWRSFQAGIANTVALMGSALGDYQEELIVSFLGPSGQAILAFDGDKDGRECTADCLLRLGRKFFVKAIDVSAYGRKPHQLPPEILQQLFSPYL